MNQEPSLEDRYFGGSGRGGLSHHAITAVLGAAAIAMAGWILWAPPAWSSGWNTLAPPTLVQSARAGADRTRITTALEVYRVLEDEYPRALDGLVRRGLLPPRHLYYATSSGTWAYSKRNDDYTLAEEPESRAHSFD